MATPAALADIYRQIESGIEAIIKKEEEEEQKMLEAASAAASRASDALHRPHFNVSGSEELRIQLKESHELGEEQAGFLRRANAIHHRIEGKREALAVVHRFRVISEGG